MNERKIIDRTLLTDLAKDVGLNASWRRWEKTVNGRLSLEAICLNAWLRFNIGLNGWL